MLLYPSLFSSPVYSYIDCTILWLSEISWYPNTLTSRLERSNFTTADSIPFNWRCPTPLCLQDNTNGKNCQACCIGFPALFPLISETFDKRMTLEMWKRSIATPNRPKKHPASYVRTTVLQSILVGCKLLPDTLFFVHNAWFIISSKLLILLCFWQPP